MIKKPYILCAAVHFKNENKYEHQPRNIKKGYVVCGRRHHNCYLTAYELNGQSKKEHAKDGFLTSDDKFVTRSQAAKIAYKVGQIKEKMILLVSENLY